MTAPPARPLGHGPTACYASGMDPLHVLVVEDEPTNQEVAALILRSGGHRVTTCSSGQEALALLAGDAAVDVILMDLLMPELDGLTVTRALKADPRLAAIPVLIVSARASASDRALGLAAGAEGYLTKPFRRSELLAALAGVMGHSREAGALPADRPGKAQQPGGK
ncbi:MAG: response regulator [Candidatus Sericytochromatia bacterium]|nr:response regulator [Candidatus Sericytochromatia bacterium]